MQVKSSVLVELSLTEFGMNGAIDLDGEFCRDAVEIDNVGREYMLAAKFVAKDLSFAKFAPEYLFSPCWILA